MSALKAARHKVEELRTLSASLARNDPRLEGVLREFDEAIAHRNILETRNSRNLARGFWLVIILSIVVVGYITKLSPTARLCGERGGYLTFDGTCQKHVNIPLD